MMDYYEHRDYLQYLALRHICELPPSLVGLSIEQSAALEKIRDQARDSIVENCIDQAKDSDMLEDDRVPEEDDGV